MLNCPNHSKIFCDINVALATICHDIWNDFVYQKTARGKK